MKKKVIKSERHLFTNSNNNSREEISREINNILIKPENVFCY